MMMWNAVGYKFVHQLAAIWPDDYIITINCFFLVHPSLVDTMYVVCICHVVFTSLVGLCYETGGEVVNICTGKTRCWFYKLDIGCIACNRVDNRILLYSMNWLVHTGTFCISESERLYLYAYIHIYTDKIA